MHPTYCAFCLSPSMTLAFLNATDPRRSTNRRRRSTISADALVGPNQCNAHYGGNVAQHLIDLRNTKSTLNFWRGGMCVPYIFSKTNAHMYVGLPMPSS